MVTTLRFGMVLIIISNMATSKNWSRSMTIEEKADGTSVMAAPIASVVSVKPSTLRNEMYTEQHHVLKVGHVRPFHLFWLVRSRGDDQGVGLNTAALENATLAITLFGIGVNRKDTQSEVPNALSMHHHKHLRRERR